MRQRQLAQCHARRRLHARNEVARVGDGDTDVLLVGDNLCGRGRGDHLPAAQLVRAAERLVDEHGDLLHRHLHCGVGGTLRDLEEALAREVQAVLDVGITAVAHVAPLPVGVLARLVPLHALRHCLHPGGQQARRVIAHAAQLGEEGIVLRLVARGQLHKEVDVVALELRRVPTGQLGARHDSRHDVRGALQVAGVVRAALSTHEALQGPRAARDDAARRVVLEPRASGADGVGLGVGRVLKVRVAFRRLRYAPVRSHRAVLLVGGVGNGERRVAGEHDVMHALKAFDVAREVARGHRARHSRVLDAGLLRQDRPVFHQLVVAFQERGGRFLDRLVLLPQDVQLLRRALHLLVLRGGRLAGSRDRLRLRRTARHRLKWKCGVGDCADYGFGGRKLAPEGSNAAPHLWVRDFIWMHKCDCGCSGGYVWCAKMACGVGAPWPEGWRQNPPPSPSNL